MLGGGATNAAINSMNLGAPTHVYVPIGIDELGDSAERRLIKHGIQVIRRDTLTTPINTVFPLTGDRCIVKAPAIPYLHPGEFYKFDPGLFGVLLLDGHQGEDAASHHAETFRHAGRTVILDCNDRPETDALLGLTDVAVAGESYVEARGYKNSVELLDFFRSKGCQVGGVTLGEHGVVWYEGDSEPQYTPALEVPDWRSRNTNGIGDAYHGALAYTCALHPHKPWAWRMLFASYYAGLLLKLSNHERVYPTTANVLAQMNARPELVQVSA
jgi:sugar/nucleoside kinase (ribokinase family)